MRKNYKEDIFNLRNRGYSYQKIVEELGCSKSTVSYYLGRDQKRKSLQRSQSQRERMRKLLAEIKEKSGCVDCKVKYPYYVLDFDHLENKKDGIALMIRYSSIDDILRELEKCEVVCSNCHRERSHQRRNAAIA